MFAIRASRDYVTNDDFMRAVRKVGEAKKLETTLDVSSLSFFSLRFVASVRSFTQVLSFL
jgi:hypothetical protein